MIKDKKRFTALKVLLIVWIIFTSVYFFYAEYKNLKIFIAEIAYNKGTEETVKQIVKQAEQCQSFVIRHGNWQAELINYNCPQVSKTDFQEKEY